MLNPKTTSKCVNDSVSKWDTDSVKIGDCECDIFTMCFSTSVHISEQNVMATKPILHDARSLATRDLLHVKE